MEQEKIERINALARLARERALTAEEAAQQSALRQEYLAEWRRAAVSALENTYVDDGSGALKKLRKKK